MADGTGETVAWLTLDVDEGPTKGNFEKTLNKILREIEGSSVTKIKLSVDDSSLNNIKSKIEDVQRVASSSGNFDFGFTASLENADAAVRAISNSLSNVNQGSLDKSVQGMNELVNAASITNGELKDARIIFSNVNNEEQNLNQTTVQFKNNAGSALRGVVSDGKDGIVVIGELSQKMDTALNVAHADAYNKALKDINAAIKEGNTNLEKWSALQGTTDYQNYQEYVNKLYEMRDALFNGTEYQNDFKNKLAEAQAVVGESATKLTEQTSALGNVNEQLKEAKINLEEWAQAAGNTQEYAQYEALVVELEQINEKYISGKMSAEEYRSEQERITAAMAESANEVREYNDVSGQLNEQLIEAKANLEEWAQIASNTESYVQYEELVGELEKLNNAYNTGKISGEAYETQQERITAAMAESEAQIKEYIGNEQQKQTVDKQNIVTKQQNLAVEKQYQNALNQCEAYLRKYTAAQRSHNSSSKESYAAIESEVERLKTLHNQYQNNEITLEEFKGAITESSIALKEHTTVLQQNGDATKSLQDRMSGLMTKFGSWLSASSIIMQSIQAMRKLVNASIEVEDAMAQIQIVTGATDSQMKAFFTETTELAKELGQSISDVAGAIETFARLGYSFSESSNLAEYATILANVGNTDVESATTGITSILKGFDLQASDAEHITDVLISVGQNYAISAEELFEAFERGGAALAATGATVEEAAGLFAATNAALQNASATGTLWKTVSARIRGATTELEEMGEDASDCANGISKYRDEVMALTGVDIMIDDSTYKDIMDIFVEIAGAWDGLTDTVKARVSEILGGTRQLSGISSAISNISDAIGAYDTAMNSAGTATAANDIYLETTTAHLNQLSATFQEFGYDLFDSSMMQFFIDLLKDIISAVDTLVDTFGTFGTVSIVTFIGGLTSAVKSLNSVKDSISAVTAAVGTSNMNEAFSNVSGVYKYVTAIKDVDAAQQEVIMSTMGLTGEQKQQVVAMQQLLTSTDRLKISEIAEATGCDANKLSKAACKDETERLTISELLEAMQKDESITLTYDEITALYKLQSAEKTGETVNLSFGASLKAMFASNPVGMIMMIVSALVTLFSTLATNTDIFKSFDAKVQDLKDDIDSLQETASNAADDFQSLKNSLNLDSETSLIDEYAQLSRGVDNLGNNVSLTSDEYTRFKEIENTLAELFPEIDGGLDSNGDHMLTLSKNTDIAVGSLNDLVEAYKQTANMEIADTIPDTIDDLNKLNSAYEKQRKDLQYEIEEYEKAKDILLDIGSGNNVVFADYEEYLNYFEQLGAALNTEAVTDENGGFFGEYKYTFEFNEEEVEDELNSIKERINGQINDLDEDLKSEFSSLNSDLIAWMSLDDVYQAMEDSEKSFATLFVQGLDIQKLLEDSDINNADDIENYIEEKIIKPISNMSDESQEAFSKLIEIDPSTSDESFSELEESIVQYAGRISDDIGLSVEEIVSSIYPEVLDVYNNKILEILKNYAVSSNTMAEYGLHATEVAELSMEELQEKMQEMMTDSSAFQDYSSFIGSLSTSEIEAAYTLSMTTDTSDWDLEKWMEEVKELDDYNGTVSFTLDIDAATDVLDTYNTALQETTDVTGLQSDTIEKLKENYQDLADYNAADLFEKTSYGVRINREELRNLEDEYENYQKQKNEEKLQTLADQYNKTKEELVNFTGSVEEYNEKCADLETLEQQIEDTAILESQYGALTSTYKKWQDALSAGNDRDTFESIGASYEDMANILAQGWTNDESLQQYINLMIRAEDQTGDVYEDFEKLTQEIGNTGHSLMDYYTYDEDGNLLSNGLITFIEDVANEMGSAYAYMDDTGSYVFDITQGKIDEVAKSFGTTTEFINWMVEALKDVSSVVVSEDITDTLGIYGTDIEAVVAKLQELSDENKAISDVFNSDYHFTFDYGVDNMDALDNDIAEAQRMFDELSNQTIDVDDESLDVAKVLLLDLITTKQELEEPIIMTVDTEQCEEAIGDVIGQLQDFIKKSEQLDQAIYIDSDADISDAEDGIIQLAQDMADMDKEVLLECGLDEDTVDELITALEEIADTEVDVDNVVIDDDSLNESIRTVQEIIGSIEVEDIEIGDNTGEVKENLEVLTETAEGVPTSITIAIGLSGYDAAYNKLKNLDNLASKYSSTTTGYTSSNPYGTIDNLISRYASGSGTAKASGDWGIGFEGVSLGGELGPELVVSDGKWYTIGEDSAEFFHHKPGDIVFNADQTEQIFKYGKIKNGNPRGTTFAEGTAFATGATGSGLKASKTATAYTAATGKKEAETATETTTETKTETPDTTTTTTTTTDTTTTTEEEEPSTEIIDWIEIAIDRIERAINNLATIAQSSYRDISEKLSATTSEISQVNYERQVQQQAYSRYMQQAYSVGLSGDLQRKVQNGTIDITEYDEETADMIQEYQKW